MTFEAKEDVWIRYRSDDLPVNAIVLRKGRILVIKAKSKLLFETNRPESVAYKTRGSFAPLSMAKGEVTDAGAKSYEGEELGSKSLPEEAPARPGE